MAALLQALARVFERRQPGAGETRRILNLLRAMDDQSNELLDTDPTFDRFIDEVAAAARLGYVTTGGGWSLGVALTEKGSRVLAEAKTAPVVDEATAKVVAWEAPRMRGGRTRYATPRKPRGLGRSVGLEPPSENR